MYDTAKVREHAWTDLNLRPRVKSIEYRDHRPCRNRGGANSSLSLLSLSLTPGERGRSGGRAENQFGLSFSRWRPLSAVVNSRRRRRRRRCRRETTFCLAAVAFPVSPPLPPFRERTADNTGTALFRVPYAAARRRTRVCVLRERPMAGEVACGAAPSMTPCVKKYA